MKVNSSFSVGMVRQDIILRLLTEFDKVVVGYDRVKLLSTAALFADGHVLLEGRPGTAKSLFVEVFQKAIKRGEVVRGGINNKGDHVIYADQLEGTGSNRVQMTADVKPQDLSGVKVFNLKSGEFEIEHGPIVPVNFLLVDEINRAPGKTLSSLLSAMQERRVHISGTTYLLPDPYFVMATQNPVEQEGVFPLPEAAVDRFGMKILVPYATFEQEMLILDNAALEQRDPQNAVMPVLDTNEVVAIREQIKKDVYVSNAAREYIVRLVRASRPEAEEFKAVEAKAPDLKKLVKDGCGVRAQQSLRAFGRVVAWMQGRDYVTVADIQEVAPEVLRHRIAMNDVAAAKGHKSDEVTKILLEHVPFLEGDDKYTKPAN